MNRFKSKTFGLAAAGLLLVAVPASAMAGASHEKGSGWDKGLGGGNAVAFGSVTSTDTNSFVLTTAGASGVPYTISTSADTKFMAVNPADNATFQSGDSAFVRGAFVNGFYARTVWYDSAPFALPGAREEARGTGVSNDANTLVLTDPQNNTDTFSLNSLTKFFVNGKPTDAASVPNVNGDRVEVQAAGYSDGSLEALRVSIRLPKPQHKE